MKCVFCGDEREEVLHQHHVYPKFVLDRYQLTEGERVATITMCHNCHTIVHDIILGPIEQVVKEERKKK